MLITLPCGVDASSPDVVRLRDAQKKKRQREGSDMRRVTIEAAAVAGLFAALIGAAHAPGYRYLSGSSDQGGCSGRALAALPIPLRAS